MYDLTSFELRLVTWLERSEICARRIVTSSSFDAAAGSRDVFGSFKARLSDEVDAPARVTVCWSG